MYAAWWRQKPVAVKKFTVASDGLREVQMHLSVGRSPNVVQLKALAQMGSSLYMVMEYFPRCGARKPPPELGLRPSAGADLEARV